MADVRNALWQAIAKRRVACRFTATTINELAEAYSARFTAGSNDGLTDGRPACALQLPRVRGPPFTAARTVPAPPRPARSYLPADAVARAEGHNTAH